MAKILIIVGAILLIGLLGFFIYQKTNEKTTATTTTSAIMPGSDRDEHGCIPSAGYSWCESKKQCLRSWEETCPANGR